MQISFKLRISSRRLHMSVQYYITFYFSFDRDEVCAWICFRNDLFALADKISEGG